VAGDVITTGTRAADTARVDAPRGTDPETDAEQAEAGAASVPGRRTADGPAAAAAKASTAAAAAKASTAAAAAKASTAETAESPAPDQSASAEEPRTEEPPTGRPGSGQARTSRARAAVAAVQGQAADVAASGVGVRRRLARLGAQRGTSLNPVLEPLIKTVRATHPKAD
jgi:guanosine-3',5'-bis(diphosphate) 3'-pyrophosphohydrolase